VLTWLAEKYLSLVEAVAETGMGPLGLRPYSWAEKMLGAQICAERMREFV
jgi:hypothetical protein